MLSSSILPLTTIFILHYKIKYIITFIFKFCDKFGIIEFKI